MVFVFTKIVHVCLRPARRVSFTVLKVFHICIMFFSIQTPASLWCNCIACLLLIQIIFKLLDPLYFALVSLCCYAYSIMFSQLSYCIYCLCHREFQPLHCVSLCLTIPRPKIDVRLRSLHLPFHSVTISSRRLSVPLITRSVYPSLNGCRRYAACIIMFVAPFVFYFNWLFRPILKWQTHTPSHI